MGVKEYMKLNTDIYKPIKEVSRLTKISRQWINTKANQGSIRVIKPFEDVNMVFYNLDDAKKLFDVK